jgi:protease-4
MQPERRPDRRRVTGSYAVVVVLGVVVGALLASVVAPIAWTDAADTGGTVAVVPIEGGITGTNAEATIDQLERAGSDPSVEAVVLVSNSPGGSAAASERLYLAVSRLAGETPVVASVDASATSGAYYAIAPSDRIYVKPSSIVGSVGVLALLGPELDPNDLVATTGPDKLGEGPREFRYTLESLQNAFVGAVFEQRGDRIDIPRSEVAKAGIYPGGEAVRTGLADDVGGRERAIREAADRAGLDSYDVETFRPEREAQFLSRNAYLASSAENRTLVDPSLFTGREPAEGPVILMLPARFAAEGGDAADGTATNATPVPDRGAGAPATEVTP